MLKLQKGSFLPILGVLVLIIIVSAASYYLGLLNTKVVPQIQIGNNDPDPSATPAPGNVSVRIVAGDLVVYNQGSEKKITNWGYNSDSTLSPDNKMIAFVSKTEESFENEKKFQGYVPGSTNVWLIKIDGSDEVKITAHKNWIYRRNLVWLDNEKLLYTEGESSANVYDLDSKLTKTVLGPAEPDGVCVDACGAESKFMYSPDKKYLLLLSSDSNGGILASLDSAVLNTQTLKSTKIDQKFSNIAFDSVVFNGDKASFRGAESVEDSEKNITIDLLSGAITFQNI